MGHRSRHRAPRPPRVSGDDFMRIVDDAVKSLPEEFRRLLDNVVVAVEEEATEEDYELTGTPDDDELLGIFRGPMRIERSFDDLPSLPPEVVVFRGPILRCTSSRGEAVREIRDTLVHELGHFFGLEDDEMPY